MAFDLDSLLNQTVEEPLATNFTPIPEGEYAARPDGPPTLKAIPGKKDPSQTFYICQLLWSIEDEGLKAQMKRDKIIVRDEFFVDFDANGKIATGPDVNVTLGKRMEAAGLNAGGASLMQLGNAGLCMIKVVMQPNEKDPENPFSKVSRVVALR